MASFDVQVHITSEGIVRRIERGYLCQKWARILGVRMEEDAIEAKNNALQALVSPKLSSTTLEPELEGLTCTATSNSAATRRSFTASSSRTNILERLEAGRLVSFVLGKLKILYCKIQADVGGQPLLG